MGAWTPRLFADALEWLLLEVGSGASAKGRVIESFTADSGPLQVGIRGRSVFAGNGVTRQPFRVLNGAHQPQ